MSDAEIVRSNARVHAWSTLLMNLGTALTAAVGYRLFVEQRTDFTTALWIAGMIVFIWAGQVVLTLLDAES